MHSDSQNQSGLKNKELTSILARMHSEQESFRKRNPDYWHIREEMIGNVEQEVQTQMGGRPRQKVSGECKNHVIGSHGPKIVLINVNKISCCNVRLFVAYLNFGSWLLVHPFKNDFSSYFQRTSFNIISQNHILIWKKNFLLCLVNPFISVQLYRSDRDPAVFPPEPPKWCLALPSKSPRLPNQHKGTKPRPSLRLPHPLPRRWWKTSYPSKSKTMDASFSSFL